MGASVDGLQPGDPGQIGRYRLLGRLGEGGMGRVFLGVSPGGRHVAVKLINPGQAGTHFRERFAREIEAARRVGGFHTAPVVDADLDADPPWMVTAYIPGPSLDDAVRERGSFGADELCRLGAGLAEGLAAIHACGLVHRDLKPSNVILAEDGPRIIDFGIARAVEASAMTTAGAVFGTFAFMSPEHVRGDPVGPASDVFSLGCTLAFAATARAPFGEDSIVTVARRIAGESPDLTGVPSERGFRQVISECLVKSAGDRPTTAALLARLTGTAPDEAARPVSGDPAPDRPWHMPTADYGLPGANLGPAAPGPPGRRSGRRRMLLTVGLAVIVILGAGLGILLTRGGPAKPSAGAHPSGAASSSPRASSSPQATQRRALTPVGPPPSRPDATLPDPGSKGVDSVVFSSDSVLAAADDNGKVYLWDVTGHLTATLPDRSSSGVNDVAFSPPGNSIAAADQNGQTFLWNAASGKLIAVFSDPGAAIYSDTFGPKGTVIAAGDSSGSTLLFNVASHGITAAVSDPGSKGVSGIAFSADGSRLATSDYNGTTYLWNTATGKRVATLTEPRVGGRGVFDVAFIDGGRLITSDDSGNMYLWDLATGKITRTLRPPGNIGGDGKIAVSPDGGFVAVVNGDGHAYVWDLTTGKLVATFADPGSKGADGVAFSPDGSFLATGDLNGRTYLWNMNWLG